VFPNAVSKSVGSLMLPLPLALPLGDTYTPVTALELVSGVCATPLL
jgi:hypothetical protein